MKSALQMAVVVLLFVTASMGLRNAATATSRYAGPVMIGQLGGPPPQCPDGTLDCMPSDVMVGGPRIGH